MRRAFRSISSRISLLLLAMLPLAANAEPDEKLPVDGVAYRPVAKASINSLEVARSNLAELMSGKNRQIPGLRVSAMPHTCTGTSKETLLRLGKGGPSYASIACRQDKLLYAIYQSVQVLATGFHASNDVSVNFSDLDDANLNVRQVSTASMYLETMQSTFTVGERTPDGRPNPLDLGSRPFSIALRNGTTFFFSKLEEASAFADNLFFIQSLTLAVRERRTAKFEEKLALLRAGAKTAVTEDQRRLIVQANLMTQRKNFALALDLYQQALDIDPVAHPDSYFNSALLAAEMERFPLAMDYMKKYLVLLPNGKDARQAQDKIYEWELLAGMSVKP